MSLYMIQDDDSPRWVIASGWGHALIKWQERMREENGPGDYDPNGITKVCDEEELIR